MHHDTAPAPLVAGARALGASVQCVPVVAGKLDVPHLVALIGCIRRQEARVFHAHLHWPLACKYGIAAARAARVPAVVATAQLHVELPHDGFVDLQHRLMTAFVDRYIAVSEDVAANLGRRFGVSASKITVVPNAADLAEPQAAGGTGAADWPVRDGRRAVLVLARLEAEKGVDVAIQAAALVPEIDLVIAGDGSCRAALETTAAKLRVAERVHFLGYRPDPAALLANADVFVLPSLVEGFPLSVVEAMAAGVPVVATDIGGTREAVEHERTGLLVPPRDAAALAAAIRRTLSEPGATSTRVAAARDRVTRELSAPAIAARVTAIYDSLLGGHA
jgi:glycosyltransferase involved in cell wall biosynthesis